MAVPRAEGGLLLNMYIHLRNVKLNEEKGKVKQEKLCEAEDMLGWPEELGAENTKPRIRAAHTRQVGGDHYKKMDIQPWDVIDHGPRQQAIGFYRYNGLKYIMRAGEKGDFKEDIQKAHHYLQKLLELL